MRRLPLAGIAAAAALALAGCGGGDSSSEKAEIERVVNDYFTAFATGDGAKACGQLTTDAQVELVEATRANDCPEALEVAAKQPDVERFREDLADAEVVEVDITGPKATATVRALGVEEKVPLAKQDGAWKIEGGQIGA